MNTLFHRTLLAFVASTIIAAVSASAASNPSAGADGVMCSDAGLPMEMSEYERRQLIVEIAHHALQSARIVGAASAVHRATLGDAGDKSHCRTPAAPLGSALSTAGRIVSLR